MADAPATKLTRVLQVAGIAIEGVSPDATAPGGYRISPSSLQAAAQPYIDVFNPNDPAHETAALDATVTAALDQERLISAIVWTILDTYSAPATITKYNTARTKIINAYKTKPWAP